MKVKTLTRFYKLKYWVLLSFSIALISFIFFLNKSNFDDQAIFGGDTWEYQSVGVNLALGHGFPKFGGLEPLKIYKFTEDNQEITDTFINRAGEDDFYRTPLYPLFLGCVYKIFGVTPYAVKIIQLLLLSIVGGSLPFIGYYFWNRLGLLAGIISIPIFFATNYEFSKYILTESLIVFFLFLNILTYIYFERKPNTPTSILLGLIFGLSLLLKGSFIFVPGLFFFYYSYLILKNNDKFHLKNLVKVFLTMFIIILPWSIFATKTSGNLIVLSNQGDRILLTFNNELSADGGWHPEYENFKNGFYQNDNLSSKPAFLRVINFYYNNPQIFYNAMKNKLLNSFYPFAALWAFFIINILILIKTNLIRQRFKTINSVYLVFSMLALIVLPIFGFIEELNRTYYGFLHNAAIFFPLALLGIVSYYLNQKKDKKYKIPVVFIIIFTNLLITIIVTGFDGSVYKSRYVKVAEFIFILTTFYFLLRFLVANINNTFILSTINSTTHGEETKKH